ncbi:MAG: hypothetical protein JWL66_1180 [Sphingomonadales bacterium]|nr:hypothetical protein [Sphingomonadales bacterium]
MPYAQLICASASASASTSTSSAGAPARTKEKSGCALAGTGSARLLSGWRDAVHANQTIGNNDPGDAHALLDFVHGNAFQLQVEATSSLAAQNERTSVPNQRACLFDPSSNRDHVFGYPCRQSDFKQWISTFSTYYWRPDPLSPDLCLFSIDERLLSEKAHLLRSV